MLCVCAGGSPAVGEAGGPTAISVRVPLLGRCAAADGLRGESTRSENSGSVGGGSHVAVQARAAAAVATAGRVSSLDSSPPARSASRSAWRSCTWNSRSIPRRWRSSVSEHRRRCCRCRSCCCAAAAAAAAAGPLPQRRHQPMFRISLCYSRQAADRGEAAGRQAAAGGHPPAGVKGGRARACVHAFDAVVWAPSGAAGAGAALRGRPSLPRPPPRASLATLSAP